MPLSLCGDNRVRAGVFALVLLVFAFLLYLPTAGYDFVDFDDADYLERSPALTNGPSWSGVPKAFLKPTNDLWIPVTSLSFLLDAAIRGTAPAGFHRTGIVLHAVAAALLFLVLWQFTGALFPGLAAVALWAAHPLRVESVAWVSGRKDVLAMIFLALALLCHLQFVRTRRPAWLAAVWFTFAVGLMAKPSLTTAPALFLLLDYWPLGRFRENRAGGGRAWLPKFGCLVREKAPLFLLAIGAAALAGGSIYGAPEQWVPTRGVLVALDRSTAAPWVYLRQVFWPFDLGLRFAPRPAESHGGLFIVAAIAIATVTAFLLAARRRRPYLVTGWLWYLVGLLPVSGIVPTGIQWLADRYTYLPHFGLGVALSWGVRDLVSRRRLAPGAAAMLAVGVFIVLVFLSRHQMPIWRDSISLFSRAVALEPHDPTAVNNLGKAYGSAGMFVEAIPLFRRAAADARGDVLSRFNLGLALEKLGLSEEALRAYQDAISVDPGDAPTRLQIGRLLLAIGRPGEAAEHLEEFLRTARDPALVSLARAGVEAAHAQLRAGPAAASPEAPQRP